MPLYNTKPVFLILIPLLMLHHNSKTSFEFPNFSGPYRNEIIFYQGDAASASNGTIHLTATKNNAIAPFRAGRASYALPVRLWDSQTGNLASFTTTFSFAVSTNRPTIGDGVSFFISPFHSEIPKDSSGGYLGLFSAGTAFKTFQNQIVAVEFDTFQNQWDPPYPHIGIDINTIDSVTLVEWQNENVENELTIVIATITYEPLPKKLSVVVSYPESEVEGPPPATLSLSHVIDLKTVLPEWVSVGFSGATGGLVEEHQILSWSFSSSL